MRHEGVPAFILGKINATPPPKHMRVKGLGNDKLKFDADRFAALCIKEGKDPAEMALRALNEDGDVGELKLKDRIQFALEMMQYLYPKLRATEHSGSIDMGLAELLSMAEKEWNERSKPDTPVEG